jgi:hypothetical protein
MLKRHPYPKRLLIDRYDGSGPMKKITLALAALLLGVSGALSATVQFNVTVPGSGTPFDFDSDGTNNWPLVRYGMAPTR